MAVVIANYVGCLLETVEFVSHRDVVCACVSNWQDVCRSECSGNKEPDEFSPQSEVHDL